MELRPRKKPTQARAQVLVYSVLQAAARVLAAESLQGFNTNRVAAVAGVSVGSLYQYFPNKAALMAALIEQAQHQLATAVETAVARTRRASLQQSVAALARVAIAQQYGAPLLAAALDHEERRLPVQRVLSAAQQRLLASVVELLQRHAHELTCAPSAGAARDCLLLAKALVEADAGSTRAPRGLQQRLVRALMGYLTCPLADSGRTSRPALQGLCKT